MRQQQQPFVRRERPMTQREVLEQSLAELQSQVAKHQELVKTVFEGRTLDASCVWSDCHHQQVLLSLLVETVQVLDETRKSFKSKQLEQLRKRLLSVLTEQTRCTSAAGKLLEIQS
jgi:hypothetical protein